jgi:undecaprenyl-diphosphatase
MTILQALVLGVIQGATEFIPVSSSGHLVLVPWLLGWEFEPRAKFVFDVLVQWGTLAALFIVYWRDLWALVAAAVTGLLQRRPLATPEARLAWLIVLATMPAVLAGLLFKDFFEATWSNPLASAVQLVVTGLILAGSERMGPFNRRLDSMGWLDAVLIGLAQAVSILPAISRSGATIAGGLGRNLERPAAARFSFLMAAPALLGAGLLTLLDLIEIPGWTAQIPTVAAGFVAALIVGYFCIRWLIAYLSRRPLNAFAAYCIVAGLACTAYALLAR